MEFVLGVVGGSFEGHRQVLRDLDKDFQKEENTWKPRTAILVNPFWAFTLVCELHCWKLQFSCSVP